jgi:hypothetical protein
VSEPGEAGGRLRLEIRPEPTEPELAAIVAAVQTVVIPALTQPAPAGPARPVDDEPSRWRFAGRWWSKPVPLQRNRP